MNLDMRLGDCLEVLPTLEAGSVHCCVTSPPYWGLRDYGFEGQLGLEATLEEYVAKMVEVFREVRRVLRDDGTLWLNLGDTYNTYSGNRGQGNSFQELGPEPTRPKGYGLTTPSLKYKDLVGIPWAVAFALRADGWYLRSDIIWHKSNPMPESCTDRPTKSHEYVFLLTKSAKYFYDADAIAEKGSGVSGGACIGPQTKLGATKHDDGHANIGGGIQVQSRKYDRPDYATRNKRSVWTIRAFREEWKQFLKWRDEQVQQKPDVWKVPTQGYPNAHFATFPEKLILPCILAGTSEEGCCAECGAPWVRLVEKQTERDKAPTREMPKTPLNVVRAGWRNGGPTSRTTGWQPICTCNADTVPCSVCDPFLGSGTTAKVAQQYGRSFVGCELSAEYLELARDRFKQARLFG